jgi:hypothetical protein
MSCDVGFGMLSYSYRSRNCHNIVQYSIITGWPRPKTVPFSIIFFVNPYKDRAMRFSTNVFFYQATPSWPSDARLKAFSNMVSNSGRFSTKSFGERWQLYSCTINSYIIYTAVPITPVTRVKVIRPQNRRNCKLHFTSVSITFPPKMSGLCKNHFCRLLPILK